MQIYLPIAGIPIDIFTLLLLSGITGIMSGMFGIGGGFLMTPLLIFMGIPPTVAVASSTNQTIASSFSGCLSHLRRNNVDTKMGLVMILGGVTGSLIGIFLFNMLDKIGQIDLVIHICYVLLLGSIGIMMMLESVMQIIEDQMVDDDISQTICPNKKEDKKEKTNFLIKKLNFLPFHVNFPIAKIEMSVFIPLFIAMFAGILVSLMGVGGGFIIMPAMLYIFRMKTIISIGTSLFQIAFVTSFSTFLHAVTNHSVDIILTILMFTGSTIGAQFGSSLAIRTKAVKIRMMMSIVILMLVAMLAHNLITEPSSYFSVIEVRK